MPRRYTSQSQKTEWQNTPSCAVSVERWGRNQDGRRSRCLGRPSLEDTNSSWLPHRSRIALNLPFSSTATLCGGISPWKQIFPNSSTFDLSAPSNDSLASIACQPRLFFPTTMSSKPFAESRVRTATSSLSFVLSHNTGGAVKSEGQRSGRSCLASQSTGSCWYSKDFPYFKK